MFFGKIKTIRRMGYERYCHGITKSVVNWSIIYVAIDYNGWCDKNIELAMSKNEQQNNHTPSLNRSYEDNPDDKEALQKAIKELPIKDYSEFEIATEGKAFYEDALFQDDESLLKATTEAVTTPSDTVAKPEKTDTRLDTKKTTTSKLAKSHQKPAPKGSAEKNYRRFLSLKTPQQHPDATDLTFDSPELSIVGINRSRPNPICLPETIIIETIDTVLSTAENATDKVSSETQYKSSLNEAEKQSTASSFFKKLQAKATEELSLRKEQVDEYLGRTLPARELQLGFQSPKLKPAKAFNGLYSEHKMAELLQAKKIKNSILSRCEQALANVVKSDLSNHKKANIFAVTEQPLAERSRSLIHSFERKPHLTADADRAEATRLCLKTIHHLMHGYKQLYSQLYEANNLVYGPQRDRAHQYAFKLIELLCLEQRLCIASHHNTADVSLRILNNMYLALAMYEPEQLVLDQDSVYLGMTTTIRSLFINYQLLSALQTQQLSAELHKTLIAYLLEHQASINILPLNHHQRLEQPTWCIEHNHSGPAVLIKHLKVKSDGDTPCLYIQIQGFFNAVKKDYCHVLNKLTGHASNEVLSTSLTLLNSREKLIILSMLNDSVSKIESAIHPAQFSRYETENTQVYSGIKDAIALLHFEAYQHHTTSTDSKPQKPPPAQSSWSIAHEDGHSIYLQTDELKSKLSLDIGQVLLLSKTSVDENDHATAEFRLGHVVSLSRELNGKIAIHLEKYGEDTAAIQIQSKHHTIDAMISDAGDDKYLLLAKSPYLKAGTAIAIEFDDGLKTTIVIDQLITVTSQCYVYRLNG